MNPALGALQSAGRSARNRSLSARPPDDLAHGAHAMNARAEGLRKPIAPLPFTTDAPGTITPVT